MKPRLHISLLAAASLLTFALGAPCQAATEAPSADKATSYSEEDKDLLDTAQGLFQALPDAAAMQKLRPFTDAQVRLGQQLWFEPASPVATPSAVTPVTTWPRQAWTTCPPARVTRASSVPATRPRPSTPPCWVTSSGTAVPLTWKNRQVVRS